MTRRRLGLTLILFLFATAAATPIAYFFGMRAGSSASAASYIDYYSNPGAFVDTSEAVWSCEQFGDFPGMRNNLRERACGGRGGERNRSGSGALRRAVFETIAGGGGAPFERLEAPAPLLASASAVMSDPFGETVPATVESAELSFLQSPTFGAGGGLPYNLVLGAVAPGAPGDPDTPFTPNTPGDPGGNPGPLPPDITPVPLPAAAPLLLTGAIGLFAAGSRRKKASA